ncbi:MAG: 4Fe-4S binding protein, partial [Phocaeicola sp.]|nr:4Fe-4S binding protein [Phocaeicola sp.]
VKVCPFEAIALENNLAYIDPNKCKSCRKCEAECPKGAIQAINFPPRKLKSELPPREAVVKPATVSSTVSDTASVNPTVSKTVAQALESPKAEA